MSARTVLVTGCDSGLGREFARQYAAEGWSVHATYLDPANRIAEPGLAGHHRLDVTDAGAVAALARALAGVALGTVICCAGLGSDRRGPGALDHDQIGRLFATNAMGVLRVAEALLPSLEAAGRARLVLISSRLGSIGENISGGHIGYRASKAALNAIGRTLAVELFPRGILVLMLHPGWVRTANGGDAAPLSAADSVMAMRSRIAELGSNDTGQFLTYSGRPIPW